MNDKIRAKTMVEMKAALRHALGWADRRSWTYAEWREMEARYTISVDYKRGDFVAELKNEQGGALIEKDQ